VTGERVVLALGANLGRPRLQLLAAVADLSRALGAISVAPLYRSVAVSPQPQPDFLNSVVLARTTRSPHDMLRLAKELERRAGRVPGPRHGPRPLDIDLLVHGERCCEDVELTLPHPQLRHRAFVLAPLAALLPGLPIPPDGRTAAELLAAVASDGVRRVSWLRDP
jgi:dihydroneopterin aldolase/2-amino-4-hydroxy-6-hydroxymethyldihydropteridine diphosphokinase